MPGDDGYMTQEEALSMLREGRVDEWNGYRERNPKWIPHLSSRDKPANLEHARLDHVNLEAACLEEARMDGVTLRHANLWAANLSGARLMDANLEDSELGEASLAGAELWGANICGARMWMTILDGASVTGVRYDRKSLRGNCLGMRGVDSTYGNPRLRRDLMDQDYVDSLGLEWQSSWRHWCLFLPWGWIDYGRSIGRVALCAVILALLFGALYAANPGMLNTTGSAGTWFTPWYYSIVTYTTLGLGDVTPATLGGEIAVTFEVILGYVTLGLLISVLANKVARRA